MLNSFQITLKLTLCKHAVKKLPFKIRYIPDQYKNQQMCDKAILENGGVLCKSLLLICFDLLDLF